MEYKITYTNSFKAIAPFAYSTTLMVAILIYFVHQSSFNYKVLNLWLVLYLVIAIPNCFLQLQYYYYNHGTKLEILQEQAKLIWTNKLAELEVVPFDEIDKIEIFMAPSWYRRSNLRLMPFENYHYAKIYTKSKKEIIITSLMASKVEDAMKSIIGVLIERKRRSIVFIF